VDGSSDPYEPGAGTLPPELAGREQERATFDTRVARLAAGRRAQAIALWGLRGVGKTVLLRDFQRRASAAGWAAAFYELGGGEQLRPVVARAAIDAFEAFEGRRQLRPVLERALGVLRSFTVTAMPHGVSFSLQVEPQRGRADSGELEHDTYDVLAALGGVAKKADSGVVILFDELQLAAAGELGAILRAWQQLEGRELPMLLIGAGLPDLPGRLVEAASYAERMFTYHEIAELDRDAARDALALPAERAGVRYEPDALELLLDRAGGFPFFLQTYGSHAWRAASGSPITLDAAERADRSARRALDQGFHRIRWERVSPAEQRCLFALASLGDGPQPIAEVNRQLGAKAAKETSLVRENLIKTRGLIHSAGYGLVAFNMPLFGEFVRRQQPAGTPSTASPLVGSGRDTNPRGPSRRRGRPPPGP
jgi:hypothetical protein